MQPSMAGEWKRPDVCNRLLHACRGEGYYRVAQLHEATAWFQTNGFLPYTLGVAEHHVLVVLCEWLRVSCTVDSTLLCG